MNVTAPVTSVDPGDTLAERALDLRTALERAKKDGVDHILFALPGRRVNKRTHVAPGLMAHVVGRRVSKRAGKIVDYESIVAVRVAELEIWLEHVK